MKKAAEITADDLVKVNALRDCVKANLTAYYDTDFNLLRWLQAYPDKQINYVANKLKNHLKARSTIWKMDELSTQARTHPVHEHWSSGITGISSVIQNAVVNIEQTGHIDYRGMLKTYSVVNVMRAKLFDLEDMLHRVMKIEETTGRQASVLHIMDLSGLQYNRNLYELIVGPMRRYTEFVAEHYVELIKFFVLVNAPPFVFAMMTVIRPLLSERTRNKIHMLSSSGWRKDILKYAQPEILPKSWNLLEENIFKFTIELPKFFPENAFYKHCEKCPGECEEISVHAGKFSFMMKELQIGDKLSFRICANANFDFGIFLSEAVDEQDIRRMETVYPNFGCIPGPTVVPIEDYIIALKDGEYKIYFSNEKAWWGTVNIQCLFEVVSSANKCLSLRD